MVSSALVSTDGGPILRSSGVLLSNLSHSVDRGTLKAFETAFLDMRPHALLLVQIPYSVESTSTNTALPSQSGIFKSERNHLYVLNFLYKIRLHVLCYYYADTELQCSYC